MQVSQKWVLQKLSTALHFLLHKGKQVKCYGEILVNSD